MKPILALMTSCPERTSLCRATVADLRASDWGRAPKLVFSREVAVRRAVRIERGAWEALNLARRSAAPWLLLLEDDLEFNRSLRYNLDCWWPLAQARPEEPFFGVLCNLGIRPLRIAGRRAYSIGNPRYAFGCQAILMSRITVDHLVRGWSSMEGGKDERMFGLAARLGPLYVHRPSLVQHVGRQSTWCSYFRYALDYQPHWLASDR